MKLHASLLVLFSSIASADDAGLPQVSVKGCVEIVPPGATRPSVTDVFPDRGTSGWASTLTVEVEHGKGETVLPNGLQLQSASEVTKDLRAEGWVIPDQDGGAGARLVAGAPDPATGRVKTKLEIPLLALPPEPGRHKMSLPALPIAVARANGDIATVCTHEHRITVDDPIASDPDPKPHPNPQLAPQREEWTDLKRGLQIAGIAALIAIVVYWLVRKWLDRPKPVVPPPPPRPPWEVALEQLDEVRHAGLLTTQRYVDYFDRTSDALRRYLGARYGFDGLESTTDEILVSLENAQLQGITLPEVATLLRDSDLVKFAKFTPTDDECSGALEAAEKIVRATMPHTPKAPEGSEQVL
jgi:hypothetical protein